MTDLDENAMKEIKLIDAKGGGSPISTAVYTSRSKEKRRRAP